MSKKPKTIHVSVPFECPFNVGFTCTIDENIEQPLICEDDIPHQCPLIDADFFVSLVRDRRVK